MHFVSFKDKEKIQIIRWKHLRLGVAQWGEKQCKVGSQSVSSHKEKHWFHSAGKKKRNKTVTTINPNF